MDCNHIQFSIVIELFISTMETKAPFFFGARRRADFGLPQCPYECDVFADVKYNIIISIDI